MPVKKRWCQEENQSDNGVELEKDVKEGRY